MNLFFFLAALVTPYSVLWLLQQLLRLVHSTTAGPQVSIVASASFMYSLAPSDNYIL